MSTGTLDTTQERLARRIFRGRLTPLPKRPRGDRDTPEGRAFVRRVTDLAEPDLVVRTILGMARQAADYRRLFEEEWRVAVRAWWQRHTDPEEDSWEHDHYLPIVFKHTETALPALVAATLDTKRIWRMEALGTRVGREVARAQERLCNWQAFTTSGAEEAYEEMYWWAALLGTAFLDHYWEYEEQDRFQAIVRLVTDPHTGQPRKIKEVVEQQGVVVADTPKIVTLNPLDVWPSPDGRPGADCPWFIERVRTTIDALRSAAQQVQADDTPGHIDGEALEEWIARENPGAHSSEDERDWFDDLVSDTWDQWMRELGYQGRDDDKDPEDHLTGERVVTLLRYTSRHEIITLGSPQAVIGYSRNPYIHAKTGKIIHHFFKVPSCPYGRGLGQVLKSHQSIANENINRWLDTAAVEAAAPVIVQRNAVSILDEDFVWEPNKILRALDVNAIKRLEMPAPTELALRLNGLLQGDADDVTGFTEQARGNAPAPGQTATAFQGLQNNLRTRITLHIRRSARTIQQSGDLLLALNQQFLTEAQVVGLVGEDAQEYVEIQPWEIVGKTVVRATLNASRAQPELRAQRLAALTQVVLPVLMQGGAQIPAVARWLRMMLDENEVEDAHLIVPRVPSLNRDPLMENEALKRGVELEALPTEDHMAHIPAHGALHEDLLGAGIVGAAGVVQRHLQSHLLMAAQQALTLGGGPPGMGPQGPEQNPGGTPAEQAGSATEGAAARQGTPGVASPGPAAPPGRPGPTA